MAELQPPEVPIGDATTPTAATTAAPAIAPGILPASVDTATTTNNNNNNLGPSLARKRQRRPSVRLGEIGDQSATLSYDSHVPRRPKAWRFYKDPCLLAAKSSKTRPLTNLVNGHEIAETNNSLDFGNRGAKSKRATTTKRVRTNWTAVNKVDNNGMEGETRDVNKNNEEFRDFKPEVSPLQSVDNVGLDFWQRTGRDRISESRDRDQDDADAVPETSGDRNFGSDSERGRNQNGFLDDRVRNWLIGLGLGSYAAVFEVHEVDDEVLPMLTLEDLKDMGINAVGSRRKLYAAIQNLPKGFS